ncbi:hypothetical protein G6K91_00005 [Agrobacterium rhizogenes]|nr:hypothetical protein [Rhizobium rhizogenes]NTG51900.1 hypothetical protein [Rhizobium rhizogenes]NTG97605.1 hypothetical protein [Rhizobium rhizogenes]NTI53320.1 hypothetical protein [Rhizobium rhizogenes]
MSIEKTKLWIQSLSDPRDDASADEQLYFADCILGMRERVGPLVELIRRDMPGYTVHDMTHLDALWETASLLAGPNLILNPPEAFVFGGAVLLHDAAMSLAAYPGGISELKETIEYQDFSALRPTATEAELLSETLRMLHARSAEALATQKWHSNNSGASGTDHYLIERSDPRDSYGASIGTIAHSHWWPIGRVERELDRHLGPMPAKTKNDVDLLKLACLLRVADAIHLDRRRAPTFTRVLDRPQGYSDQHWQFQNRLAFPRLHGDALQFTSGQPCPIEEADSWWLGYEALSIADKELRETDALLRDRRHFGLAARRIKSIADPVELAQDIPVVGWKPIDTRVHVSDVYKIVRTLGGSKLYGDDPRASIRELLQNCVDAVHARRRLQDLPKWGSITVSLEREGEEHWLVIEDDGIGMSERVLTGNLLDFGSSFWSSPAIIEEYPSLASRGLRTIGKFGIGFFAVFMLGDHVVVSSRRCDRDVASGLTLKFKDGLVSRPLLSKASPHELPPNGGTTVRIRLFGDPSLPQFGFVSEAGTKATPHNFSFEDRLKANSLDEMVAQIVPASGVDIYIKRSPGIKELLIGADDWKTIPPLSLARRVAQDIGDTTGKQLEKLMLPITTTDGEIVGRAALVPLLSSHGITGAEISKGFRIQGMRHILGVLPGEIQTAARNTGVFTVPKDSLREWATAQAKLLARSNFIDHEKALSAEIILECGGNIGSLPIAKRGEIWLNQKEIKAALRELNELRLHVGEIEHDDEDNIGKGTFEASFHTDSQLFVVPTVTGQLSLGYMDRYWSFNKPSQIQMLIEKLIKQAWRSFVEDDDHVPVGEVDWTEIYRSIAIYRRPDVNDCV